MAVETAQGSNATGAGTVLVPSEVAPPPAAGGADAGAEKAAAGAAPEGTQKKDGAPTQGEVKPAEAPLALKFPEGFDAGAAKELEQLAKDSGLKGEAAQKLVEFTAKQEAARASALQQHLDNTKKQWVEAVKGDKELGGANYDATVKLARQALNRFVDADTKKMLAETGLGNHPGLVRAFHAVGKAIAEDTVAGGHGSSAPSTKSAEDIFRETYPSMFKE